MSLRAAGFTLLEIMVALVVFSLVLIGLTQGVRFGLQAWKGQTAMIDQRGDIDAVDTVLRDLIAPMDPGYAVDPPDIIGLPHALAFTTQLPRALGEGAAGHADISLSVDEDQQLLLRWTPHLHATRLGGAPAIRSAILLSHVRRIDVRYWDASTAGGKWANRWVGRAPPGLIGIKLVFANAGLQTNQPDWPEIVIAPMRESPN